MSGYEERRESLYEIVESFTHEDIAVAFSGGVDSSLILKISCDAAQNTGKKVIAFMFRTMLHPTGELSEAKEIAEEAGAIFRTIEADELSEAGIANNPTDRCYRCKQYLFKTLRKEVQKYGISTILEGTNDDDLHLYRPGIRAVNELGIISPLALAQFTKADVRKLAKMLGISVSDKPSTPCLATRFPYGTTLSYDEIYKVERGEEQLKLLGLYNVRLRIHGDVARIEVDRNDMEKLMERKEEITSYLKNLGYTYVTLDLEGFRSGSMDYYIDEKARC